MGSRVGGCNVLFKLPQILLHLCEIDGRHLWSTGDDVGVDLSESADVGEGLVYQVGEGSEPVFECECLFRILALLSQGRVVEVGE